MTTHTTPLRQTSSDTTIIVLSHHPAFLAAFLEWSLKGLLPIWSTRLLIVTRCLLPEVQELHTPLSKLNAMLVIISEDKANIRSSVYIHLPYSHGSTQALKIASWTPCRGLVLTSHLPLFPDKFSKFSHGPNLLVAAEVNPANKIITIDDPSAPGGHRTMFRGPVPLLMGYLSKALNFTYTVVRPPDGESGVMLANGSWSGMVGMVMKEVVDVAAGPFMIDRWRGEVVDFTVPILFDYWRILGAGGDPEVNPWGFLFPLAPPVWTAILAALVVLAVAVVIMSCFSHKSDGQNNLFDVIFDYLRILLQQDMSVPTYWLWERIVLLVWMMVTLVLTRSYSGNLFALLAVRHIPQPYQSLRDVVDDPSVKIIWEKGSATIPYLKSATSGIYREIADLEKVGRLIWRARPQFIETIDVLVRRGDHVIIEIDVGIKAYIARDFTKSGRCSFYVSREGFLHVMFSMIGPKNSPIIPALDKRILSLTEAGLFYQWLKADEPNSTVCYRSSNKFVVNAALTVANVWVTAPLLLK
ncbi:probable glutamate receptor [Cherax quadricarinatus]|uniref:probable glutamate receptor n=1 Tax=Cherax quadricarinatus TaxID=27406 RepID=UPI00387EDA0F